MKLSSRIDRIILEKEVSILIGKAIAEIEKFIEPECIDKLQDNLIEVGIKMKTSNYASALLIIGDLKEISGLNYLSSKSKIVCEQNKLHPQHTELAFTRQAELADIWARHTEFHKNYIVPISEKLMLLTLEKAISPTTADGASPSATK